ncbi:MAG: ABC transporter ATP-binding protein [Desulfosarcinaceae bacterium]|nr:ABC transporter ATP-binding protein [Desulfosarcinaceae bacterium]
MPRQTSTILQLRQISKHYGEVRAVDGVDLEIPAGICFGLLGPNGAGKTTLIEIAEGIQAPTQGEVLFQGAARTAATNARMGIMFQSTALLDFMSVAETLAAFRRLYDHGADLEDLSALCHLSEIAGRRTTDLSGGQRQRLLLALALVNRPELVFLDEPSTGLDPQARHNLWAIIEDIKSQGKTIVLTTHYMEEAEHLCDTIAIMDRGRIIANGTVDQLLKAHCPEVGISIPIPATAGRAMPPDLPSHEHNGRVKFLASDLNRGLNLLLANGFDLSELQVHPPNLESVFLNLTGRHLRE